MGESPCVAPGTDLHTYTAIRADLSPILETLFIVQLPSEGPIGLLQILHGNGIGWAADGALLTDTTEIFGSDIHRLIG